MQVNQGSTVTNRTYEGAPARRIPALMELRRTVAACLLWEDQFYEDGKAIAERISDLVQRNSPRDVAALAIEAREQFKLRHIPLLLLRELARHPTKVDRLLSVTLARCVQRVDELSEFLAIYWKDGKQPISKQVKQGLAWAFRKFNEYEFGKYNRDKDIKLRDVLFLTHPKPQNEKQVGLWKRIAENKLETPDTWEVELSAGKDKKATFERLINEGKLGYLALLRNLRNMEESQCDSKLIEGALRARKGADRVLPFRFIAAARYAPHFEPVLDEVMQACMQNIERIQGTTLLLVDNSGSMAAQLSAKSDLSRADAAAGLAILARGICENVRIFAFSDKCLEVPARQGMALKDAIRNSMRMSSTHLGAAVRLMNTIPHDRLIVITDEQSADAVPNPLKKGYVINVASYKNGVGYGPWVHIDGWSESVIRFIAEYEKEFSDGTF